MVVVFLEKRQLHPPDYLLYHLLSIQIARKNATCKVQLSLFELLYLVLSTSGQALFFLFKFKMQVVVGFLLFCYYFQRRQHRSVEYAL